MAIAPAVNAASADKAGTTGALNPSNSAAQATTAAAANAGNPPFKARHSGPPLPRTATAGASRIGFQKRRKTSVPLVPPKPKLFFTATSIFICRAVLAQ